jgi:hypothetical protein
MPNPSSYKQENRYSDKENEYMPEMEKYIANSHYSGYEKLENFTKYVSRQTLGRFLALNEIFKQVIDVQGDVIECGVNSGGGLMSFAQLSAIYEPINLQRRIIGFDTFSGFPKIDEEDKRTDLETTERKQGGYHDNSYDDLQHSIALFDKNRFINHIDKVSLIKGDANHTIPEYLKDNPHTIVSLLHLDFDLYGPTKVAIENFLPRMPKGSIIIFDELNNRTWPGETIAVLEKMNINKLSIKRFPYEPHISYAVI